MSEEDCKYERCKVIPGVGIVHCHEYPKCRESEQEEAKKELTLHQTYRNITDKMVRDLDDFAVAGGQHVVKCRFVHDACSIPPVDRRPQL